MNHKTLPRDKNDYTDNFKTQFIPLPEVIAYDTLFVDPPFGRDPEWDEDLYDTDKLQYRHNHKEANDQIESNDLITDSNVSDALRHAKVDFWTVNPQLRDKSP